MKNKLLVIGVTILLIITNAITSYANTETTVKLQADKTQVKVSENFTVTLKATCPDGINGIDTTYSYDTEKLELVSANVANPKFASLGIDNQITVIANSTEKIQSADVYILTFKVKDGVAAGSTAKVSIAETSLDSDAQTNSEHIIPAQEVTVTVIAQQDTPGDEDVGNEGTSNEGAGNEDTGNGNSNEGNENIANGTGSENTKNEVIDNKETVNNDKKDQTASNKEIPKAGLNPMIVIGIVTVMVVSIILYKKNKKYEGLN